MDSPHTSESLMHTGRSLPTYSLLLATLLLVPCCPRAAAEEAAASPLQVSNHEDGSTIRYPVPLLRGTLANGEATSVTVVNQSSDRDTREMEALVHEGKFKGLTELVPGENRLLVRAGNDELPLTLTYQPQTNPYVVRVFYWTDSTGATDFQTPFDDDPQDFRGKLDTAMKVMQTFTAESLNGLGLGRRTFNMELDEAGKVQVHLLRGGKTAAEYQAMDGGQLYGEAARELARQFPNGTARNLIIPAFTRFDPATGKALAHTALGGGNLALFGGGDLFAWPDSLAEVQPAFMNAMQIDPKQFFSDSVGRHTFWAIASTTIGAALHELGHTFGLPHSLDAHDIMTRGIDRLNRFFTFVDPPHAGRNEPYEFRDDEIGYWAPVSAEALAPNRYFALDQRTYSDDDQTRARLNTKSATLRVESANGIRYVGVYRFGEGEGVQAVYSALGPRTETAPKQFDLSVAEVGKRLHTPNVMLHVIDDQGLATQTRVPDLLQGPFVQAWRFATATRPWNDHGALPALREEEVSAIEEPASSAALVRSTGHFVDFLKLCPTERQENVAGYALRTIRCEAPRKVKLLTGSDDALRMWLNGTRIAERLVLRSATPDDDTTEVELQVGENRLLVEVSQAGGGWGLFLRLEDENGTKLKLEDDGTLTPVGSEETERILALLRGE